MGTRQVIERPRSPHNGAVEVSVEPVGTLRDMTEICSPMGALAALRQLLPDSIVDNDLRAFTHDATESRGVSGKPAAVVRPRDLDEVVSLVSWSYANAVPLVPRGGGTGFAGGCVPISGGVVVELGRMGRVLQFDPHLWRIRVEAGLRTSHLQRLARENGLRFPPDPGAAEDSQIGGNIATNAGGPHAYKYGTTGDYVTGLRAVVPPGRIVEVGGPLRKDVAGYDLKRLLVGSEGTLGIITDAWLRLVPSPEAAQPIAATYRTTHAGCEALLAIIGAGLLPAALEFLDEGALSAAGSTFPASLDRRSRFMVIAEADGDAASVRNEVSALTEILETDALDVYLPHGRREIADFWRWRDGVSLAVEAAQGGKVSEDITVPLDHLEEMIEETIAIGQRHGLPACSWGHAGDGNLHSTFSIDPRDADATGRAAAAAEDLFVAAGRMRGSISGEHGLGWVKRGHLHLQWSPAAVELHKAVKGVFDPRNLMNPGKKT